jgi:hypothetical protein
VGPVMPPLVFFFAVLAAAGERGGLCSFSQCLPQQEKEGACVLFRSACRSRRKRGACFRSACCSRTKTGAVFLGQNLLQEEEGGRDALPFMFFGMFAAPGGKHPLTSTVRRWSHLSFCTLFQPCTVLQQTMQLTFQCDSKTA